MSDKLQGGILAGSTSFSTVIILRKTADNTETTGKVASDMTGSYLRQGGTRTSISLSDLASVNSAYSSGGVKEIDSTNQPGLYRLDIPDAAIATGADWVTISIKVASSYVFHERYSLTTNVVQTGDSYARIGSAGVGLSNISLPSGGLANVTAWTVNITGNLSGSVGSVTGRVTANTDQWNGTSVTTPITAGTPVVDWVPSGFRTNTAQAGAATTITLDAGASATDNFYKYSAISLLGGTGAGQYRLCTGYVGSTKIATVTPAWTTNPASNSIFQVIPLGISDVETWLATAVTNATAGIPDVNAKNINNVSTSSVTTVSANVGTTQPINFTGTGGSALAKSDMVDVAGAAVSASTAQIGTNIVNWSGSAVTAPITAGTPVVDWSPSGFRTSTATAGAGTTITLDGSASATDNFYKYSVIALVGGTGAGQYRLCTGYVGSTKVATVAPAWTTNPANGSVFQTLPVAISDIETWLGTAVTAASAGIPDVNTKNINNVSGSSVTTINANMGTTQPVNYTGTAGSALVKSDMVDIAGSAVSTSSAQIGVNTVNIAGQAAVLDGNNFLKVDVQDWLGTVVVTPATAGIPDINVKNIGNSGTAGTNLSNVYAAFETGTAQAGANTTITLRSGASATNDIFKNQAIFLVSGTGAVQTNNITGYVGSTKVASVETQWVTNPDATTVYLILGRIG